MKERIKTDDGLFRGLTLTAAIMVTIGSMIGSGVFRKPTIMAQQLNSPELMIAAWVFAGIMTLFGALTNAEIACIIDSTGGQYKYFKTMYGNFIAFIYGWAILVVIQTGSQASIAVVFSEYLGYFINYPELPKALQDFCISIPLLGDFYPLHDFGTKMVAIICILFITGINYIGVILGGGVQTLITSIKIGSIVLLAILAFSFGSGDVNHFFMEGNNPPDGNMIIMFGLALSGAFWAYDGWNNVTFVSGEIKDPKRNVPLALAIGTLAVIVIYVLINLAYLYVLDINEISQSKLVGATLSEKIFGRIGGEIISIAIIVSTFGALNGSILATARIHFAMARDKLIFNKLGESHPRFLTPGNSLIVQGVWSCLLTLSGTFDTITDYVIFSTWLFYALGAFGVFILRKKMPDAPRKYKVWGYPYVPAIFVIFSFLFLTNTLISDTKNVLFGVALIALGVPLYFYFNRKKNK